MSQQNGPGGLYRGRDDGELRSAIWAHVSPVPYACPAPSFSAGLFYWLILKRQGGLDEPALELIETTHVKREGETDLQSSIRFFATAASLVILLTAAWLVINGVPANAQDPPAREETSVKVTVDGEGPNRNVAKGDVVDNGEKTEGVDCTIPDLTIEMGGDVEEEISLLRFRGGRNGHCLIHRRIS